MAYTDLREWIEQMEAMGELKRVDGADWNLEITLIGEMSPYAILFDGIVGYPKGFRVLTNMTKSIGRWLATLGWNTKASQGEFAMLWKERLKTFTPIPPKLVTDGPVMENVMEGGSIDVLRFPVPLMHPDDGGRYVGSCDAVIMRDPDTGRLNFGNYRLQVHDQSTLGVYLGSGKDGVIIMRKYHELGKSCPVVAVVGVDPLVYFASFAHISDPENTSEYDFAGWLKGEPIEVISGRDGLLIPSCAEVAIEGEIPPHELREEGPFGEWDGYGKSSPSHIIKINRVLYRDDPILTSQSPASASRPPARGGLVADPRTSGLLWHQLERAGARGIRSVAVYANRFLQVISIKNSYGGHVRQIGHLATQCHAGAFMGRFTVVVDEEIDPYNLDQVIHAVVKWADPARAMDIVRYCWSDRMDCAIYPWDLEISKQPSAPVYSSRCVIDACRPIEWGADYHRPILYPRELQEKIAKKWGNIIFKDQKLSSLGWALS